MKDDDLMLHEMKVDNDGLNLKLGGQVATMFMHNLIELFKANGGKNFLTITCHLGDDKYAITIQNCNGVDTPAEKIQRQEDEIAELKEQMNWDKFQCEECQAGFAIKEDKVPVDEPICPVCSSDNVKDI